MTDYEKYLPLVEVLDSDHAFKDAYTNEYLKDFSPIQACHRLGIEKNKVASISKALMKDPYVIDLLRVKVRAMAEIDIVTRSEVLNALKYMAVTSTNEDTRFKAWGKLSKLLGMEVLYVKTETISPNVLPDLRDDMSVQEMANIYADEVLND